jgi:hypothetical protein
MAFSTTWRFVDPKQPEYSKDEDGLLSSLPPPYQPDFNPIENVFLVKHRVRRSLGEDIVKTGYH